MNLCVPGSSRNFLAVATLVAVALLVGGCADEERHTLGPTAVEEEASPSESTPRAVQPALSIQLECTADVRAGRLSCLDPAAPTGAPAGITAALSPGQLIVGSQDKLVRLTSSNVCFGGQCGGTGTKMERDIFRADVTVENLMGQALGTLDGKKPTPNGVRIFFESSPKVIGGTGTVTVANPDGLATFTAANQPYFQYGGASSPQALGDDGILSTEEISAPRTWRWKVAEGVQSFAFRVAVSAAVANKEALGKVRFGAGAIATGHGAHTCALADDGAAYCWGRNDWGQLGTGNTTTLEIPAPVAGGHTFTWIATGFTYTCGVRVDGKVLCWGGRSSGAIGDGVDDPVGRALEPQEVDSDETFRFVTAGHSHVCALTVDGRAYCWGVGTSGRLGNGSVSKQTRPVAVEQDDLVFVDLVAAHSHTCGLTTTGSVYCWGSNEYGQLGIGGGGGAAASYPTQVSGGLTFRSLIQGAANATCAITVDGVTYCWGAGENHVLGTGDEKVRSGPTPVLGGKPEFASVAGSSTHTCAVTVGGAAYCWGINDQGHLGNGTQDPSPLPGLVAGGLSFSSISVGSLISCGITTDGEAYCWGEAGAQQGTGVLSVALEPRRVVAPEGIVWKTVP